MAKSKSRLIFGIIFSIIYIASSIGFIVSAILIQPISFMEFMATDSQEVPPIYTLIILLFISTIITSIISVILLHGCELNTICKILYVLSLIPLGILSFGILIIIGIIWLIHKGADVQARTSSSSSHNRIVNVKDSVGHESKLEWDHNTETWRDTSGNHYTTKDEGKTFTKK